MTNDSAKSLTDVLRKSLILAFELKNDKLKGRIEKIERVSEGRLGT
jgi:hypothetical protein